MKYKSVQQRKKRRTFLHECNPARRECNYLVMVHTHQCMCITIVYMHWRFGGGHLLRLGSENEKIGGARLERQNLI